jgi:hypothetical protein
MVLYVTEMNVVTGPPGCAGSAAILSTPGNVQIFSSSDQWPSGTSRLFCPALLMPSLGPALRISDVYRSDVKPRGYDELSLSPREV